MLITADPLPLPHSILKKCLSAVLIMDTLKISLKLVILVPFKLNISWFHVTIIDKSIMKLVETKP